ncbi:MULTISPECIES: hypothetical protein [Carboxydothermus]|uniref:Uncharacterized protein n=2 Tax=Carboxydothermus TaxID=129957 RepID=Q3AEC9_CARHZ|nr:MULTISPECIES: hypothetical protein [Carboxydothermus]ABB15598.1 hypothetical protein CHY_0649 [Carboxydothermus hydrogenoformans Z-2901]NYE56522.1 Ca2+/Na+ antiporter [Carboxydothermus ferrireducens DSM 11255]
MKKRKNIKLLYFVVFGALLILLFYQQGFRLPRLSSIKHLIVYLMGVLGIILIMIGLRRQMERNHPDDDEDEL